MYLGLKLLDHMVVLLIFLIFLGTSVRKKSASKLPLVIGTVHFFATVEYRRLVFTKPVMRREVLSL